ncbi:hypothetical protein [Bradyrhizobium sp. BWC-3-1]|uniref:hypothetical protein n=1 Tax=Bradyrhizobium sp. BWC-3-1 TaxID=3080012 RepID=UPI00293EBAF2|nr:hypothetical protein [Bradyrhizobium sp. BWC-3-1]WOH57004.1 hypothetical protein RX329_32900 [Bradyrhizobium sp. BWC-3-1]
MTIDDESRLGLRVISVELLAEFVKPPFPYQPIEDFPGWAEPGIFRPSVKDRPSDQIRPRLRNDVIYTPYRDGVLFRSDRQGFFLRGPRLYQLISYLAPWLTGEFSLSEIASPLDPVSQTKLDAIIRLLIEGGILSADAPALDSGTDAKLRAQFRKSLEVIDAIGGDGSGRFIRFRSSRVLLVGSGISFGTCAASLLRAGTKQLYVINTEGNGEDLTPAIRQAETFTANGIDVSIVTLHDISALGGPRLGQFDIVAYCSDCGTFNDARFLSRAACQEGRAFLPGLVVGSRSYMGPTIQPWACGCWPCTVLRVADDSKGDNRLDSRSFMTAHFANPARANDTIATALGKDVAFELLKILSGPLRHQTDHGLVMQTLRHDDHIKVEVVPNALFPCFNFCSQLIDPAADSTRTRILRSRN